MPSIYGKPSGQSIKQQQRAVAVAEEMELLKLLNGERYELDFDNHAPQVMNVQSYEQDAEGMELDNYPKHYSQSAYDSLDSRYSTAHGASNIPRTQHDWMPPVDTAAQQQRSKAYLFEPETFPDPVYNRQRSVWSPPRAEAQWANYDQAAYRVPSQRYAQIPERPITPHDTYSYPAEHIYTAPAPAVAAAPLMAEPNVENVNAAFAVWYAQQVVNLLVYPGQFRTATAGAADEEWGPAGRERDGYERMGMSSPTAFAHQWSRMAATSPVFASRRRVEFEQHDPWNISWAHAIKPSSTLVSFVLDMIQRMTISPSALVAGVWFLAGLGLHEGDGKKGAGLRKILRESVSCEPEAVERRVATLGLILAGKWLDDNSFLTKSWFEVTTIPIKTIDAMERCALNDLNWSLYVPVASWVDHVNQLFVDLDDKPVKDDADAVVHYVLDKMATEARGVELDEDLEKKTFATPHFIASPLAASIRRLSYDETPAAFDQLATRDWDSFARSYQHQQDPKPSSAVYPARIPAVSALMEDDGVEIERAERNVEMLLSDDDMNEVESQVEEFEEDDEEFLEYDGAKKWLPTAAEMRKTSSNQSQGHPIPPATSCSRGAWPTAAAPPPAKSSKASQWQNADPFGFPVALDPSSVQRINRRKTPLNQHHHHTYGHSNRSVRGTGATSAAAVGGEGYPVGHQLEPGVNVVREPGAGQTSEFGFMSGMMGNKRWATSASAMWR
ncbi:hypothetical protein L198_00677 [Cryptococcus wingfieldii CBS 7118]|uniref:Cyclin N-terminal domain-containing protein n=1 Tax=Cryptococcus wingfieldii CBS 7118 TaxID=1295528 RepID=A0A1E3K6W5_9TREE|nr:hypothetical protein L198_00677 [Cryptococcus wingfieldii CBS 7118]ODO08938.1 hypothetical protein L198_00677 [Cryptococcus wingfieldii CBS 7118]